MPDSNGNSNFAVVGKMSAVEVKKKKNLLHKINEYLCFTGAKVLLSSLLLLLPLFFFLVVTHGITISIHSMQ